jgi:hypothetical protein
MRRHSSAHRSQATAHSRQWAASCFWHSSPHSSQISAQRAQSCIALSLPRAMNAAARRQISAQSTSSAIHRAIIFTWSSRKHAAAH